MSRDQTLVSLKVEDIPVDQIEVLNTRRRNEATYLEIEENIKTVGLKKPITVTPRNTPGKPGRYLLVCGEGRLRAFKALGQQTIPARVIHVNDEDAFVMSLAENFARRVYKPLELMAAIARLRDQGMSTQEISRQTGMGVTHINGITALIANGEERLLAAVEKGKIPIYAAVAIYRTARKGEEKEVSDALAEAVTAGLIKPSEVADAKRVAMARRDLGKTLVKSGTKRPSGITPTSIVRGYRQHLAKQQLMVRRATVTEQRLLFISGAVSQFFSDGHFRTLLRAEGLDSLPEYLAVRLATRE